MKCAKKLFMEVNGRKNFVCLIDTDSDTAIKMEKYLNRKVKYFGNSNVTPKGKLDSLMAWMIKSGIPLPDVLRTPVFRQVVDYRKIKFTVEIATMIPIIKITKEELEETIRKEESVL